MKKLILNRLVLSTLVLFIITFFCEVYVRYLVDSPIFAIATLRIAISCLALSLFYSWLFHFFKPIIQKIFNIIYVLAVHIGIFTEVCLYTNVGFFMGLGNAEQGGKVTDYIVDTLKTLSFNYWLMFIPLILVLVYFIVFEGKIIKLLKKIKGKKLTTPQKVFVKVLPLIIVGLLIGIHQITIRSDKFQDPLQLDPNYAVWLYPENSNMSVNNFGVILYLYSDTRSMLLKTTEEDVAYLYPNGEDAKIVEDEIVEADYKREIDDAAWKELDANTSDGTYKKLNNYFMNRTISQKNDMTGIFEGKNVILFLMESVNEIAILNEQDFPTLYKMYHEGISFKNNYTPRNTCSTGNNEMTAQLSLFTINNACTANTYTKNEYPEAFLSMFKKLGYKTSAYHDYTQQYYYRATYLPRMGAEKYYGVTDLGMSYNPVYQEWPSDKDMFQHAKSTYMSKDKKFAVYFAGVTTHRTYNQSSEFGDKYLYMWKDKNYPIETKRYLSKMKELDVAMEELLKELEEEGILEDTVIALFGDHYPYGLTDSQINAYLKDNNAGYTVKSTSTTNHDVDRTPMIIYNSGLKEPVVVDKYTTIIDLVPTLFNMFNMNYDPRLYLGTDVFSKVHPDRAYFVDGSWVDKNASYYAPSAKITYAEGAKQYDAGTLRNINSEISTRQSMSGSAIRSNYFKYLGEGLEKYAYLNKPKEEENNQEPTTEGQTE